MQYLGQVTATPVLVALVAPVLAGASCYRSALLRQRLLLLVCNDLIRLASPPSHLKPDEVQAVHATLARVRGSLGALERSFSVTEAETLDDATVAFLEAHGQDLEVDALHKDRRREAARAVERYRAWLLTTDAKVEARWALRRVDLEVTRVMAVGLRRVGIPVAAAVLKRAGERVTDGSVLGLVGAVCFWSFSGRSASFFLYLGNGVTLGAFLGLGLTCVAVVQSYFNPFVSRLGSSAELKHRRTFLTFGILFVTWNLVWPLVWGAGR